MPTDKKEKEFKTYRAMHKFRLAGTHAQFTPFFTTDDKALQERIENGIGFRKGNIVLVEKEKEGLMSIGVPGEGELSGLEQMSRADLVALAKRLDVKANGKSKDIISRIVESSEHMAAGSSAR